MAPTRTTPVAMIRPSSGKPERDLVGNRDQIGQFLHRHSDFLKKVCLRIFGKPAMVLVFFNFFLLSPRISKEYDSPHQKKKRKIFYLLFLKNHHNLKKDMLKFSFIFIKTFGIFEHIFTSSTGFKRGVTALQDMKKDVF